MSTVDYNRLSWFKAVADERSFTKAAAKLGVAQSTLSHTIKHLEAGLGLRLLTRTTRSVALTAAGQRLYETIGPRLAEIEDEIASLSKFSERLSGTIRLTLSDHAFKSFVWSKLEPMLKAHPDIRVELLLDSTFRNIVEEGFDAGVRLGESVEKDMIAVRISPDWRLVAVASPEYFAEHVPPRHPNELVGHRCINMRQLTAGGLYAWEFEKDGQALRVRVDGQLVFNDVDAILEAAIDGFGIAYIPENCVATQLESGALVQVLDDWSPFFDGYFLYYPTRRQNLPAFQALIDALRQK